MSGTFQNGVIGPITLESEKGRDCLLINPWPGHVILVLREGVFHEELRGERVRLSTRSGEVLRLESGPLSKI